MLISGPFRPAADVTELYANRELWLVPGIVPFDGVVILASAPKTGKTCFATALARAVAKGEPFLGEPVIQAPVLWCAYEEMPSERLLLHEGLTVDDPLLIAYPTELPPLAHRLPKTDRFGRRNLRDEEPPFVFQHASEVGARLIVIDCLHAAVDGANLAENHAARAVMGTLRVWSAHFYIAVLVLHHLTKSSTRGWQPERFADSAQILAASSCHFFMDRSEYCKNALSLDGRGTCEAEGEGAAHGCLSRIILHGRGRHPAPPNRIEIVSRGILDYQLAERNERWIEPKRQTAVDKIVDLLQEGWELTATELGQKLGIKPSATRMALSELCKSGIVTGKKRPKETLRYALGSME